MMSFLGVKPCSVFRHSGVSLSHFGLVFVHCPSHRIDLSAMYVWTLFHLIWRSNECQTNQIVEKIRVFALLGAAPLAGGGRLLAAHPCTLAANWSLTPFGMVFCLVSSDF